MSASFSTAARDRLIHSITDAGRRRSTQPAVPAPQVPDQTVFSRKAPLGSTLQETDGENPHRAVPSER